MQESRRRSIAFGTAAFLLFGSLALWLVQRGQTSPTGVPGVPSAADIAYTEADLAAAPRFALSATGVTFGAAEANPDLDLTAVTSAAVLGGGRVATFAAPGQLLLLHDADGKNVQQVGRAGAGPGEFRGVMNMLARPSDTLVVLDSPNRRISWFWNGQLVVSRAIDTPLPSNVRYVRGQLSDGDLIASSEGEFRDQGDRTPLIQPTTQIFRIASDGSAREVLAIPGIEITSVKARFMGRDVVMTDFVRYGARPHVTVQDSLIVTATGGAYQIAFHNPDGAFVRTLSVRTPRRAVTAEMRSAAVAAEFAQYRRTVREIPADRDAYERLIRDAPYADSMSVFESLHVTSDNVLWVVDAIAASDSVWTATAFDTDGRIVGRLTGSTSSRPFSFGVDAVLLRRVDDDGVTWLDLRRLVR